MTTHELAKLLLEEPDQPVKLEDYEGNDFEITGIKSPETIKDFSYMANATWLDF